MPHHHCTHGCIKIARTLLDPAYHRDEVLEPPVRGKLDVQHLADHPAAVLALAEALATPGAATPLTCMVLERLEVCFSCVLCHVCCSMCV